MTSARTPHITLQERRLILANMRDNIAILANRHHRSLEDIARAIHCDPNTLTHFVSGSARGADARLIFDVASYFGYDLDSWLQLTPEHLLETKPPLRASTYSRELSEAFNRTVNGNIAHFDGEKGILTTLKANNTTSGPKNLFVVQDCAHLSGRSVHDYCTNPRVHLLPANLNLATRVLTRTAGIVAVGAAVGLLAAAPAVAMDYAVEIASREFEQNGRALLDPSLPRNHTYNALRQLGISATQVLLDFASLPGRVVNGAVVKVVSRPLEDATQNNTSLLDVAVSDLLLPVDIVNGLASGYLNGARPIVQHTHDGLVALGHIFQNMAAAVPLQLVASGLSLDPNHVETTHRRWTALHRAFYNGDVERIKWLIANGARVEKDALGQFPHEVSPYSNDPGYLARRAECARLVDPNYVETTHRHWTALHRAFYDADVERIKWLIANGARVKQDALNQFPHEVSPYSNDPGYLARRAQCAELVDPNYVETTHRHWTALHRAFYNADIERIKWLIANGARVKQDALKQFPHEVSPYSNDPDYMARRATASLLIQAEIVRQNPVSTTSVQPSVASPPRGLTPASTSPAATTAPTTATVVTSVTPTATQPATITTRAASASRSMLTGPGGSTANSTARVQITLQPHPQGQTQQPTSTGSQNNTRASSTNRARRQNTNAAPPRACPTSAVTVRQPKPRQKVVSRAQPTQAVTPVSVVARPTVIPTVTVNRPVINGERRCQVIVRDNRTQVTAHVPTSMCNNPAVHGSIVQQLQQRGLIARAAQPSAPIAVTIIPAAQIISQQAQQTRRQAAARAQPPVTVVPAPRVPNPLVVQQFERDRQRAQEADRQRDAQRQQEENRRHQEWREQCQRQDRERAQRLRNEQQQRERDQRARDQQRQQDHMNSLRNLLSSRNAPLYSGGGGIFHPPSQSSSSCPAGYRPMSTFPDYRAPICGKPISVLCGVRR